MDRRALLQALGSLVLAGASGPLAAAGASAVAQAPLSVANFGALSKALTGLPPVNPADTATMFAAFATPAKRAALARVAQVVATTPAAQLDAALSANGLTELANALTSAWYSGVVNNAAKDGKSARVVLYTNALVWQAMSFSKPMGECGGLTGYWAKPPA